MTKTIILETFRPSPLRDTMPGRNDPRQQDAIYREISSLRLSSHRRIRSSLVFLSLFYVLHTYTYIRTYIHMHIYIYIYRALTPSLDSDDEHREPPTDPELGRRARSTIPRGSAFVRHTIRKEKRGISPIQIYEKLKIIEEE